MPGNNTVFFYADYTKSGIGTAPSEAPSIAVYSIERSSGDENSVVSGVPVAASVLPGRYYYQLIGANLQTYDYHGRFHTADSTVDQQDVPALWVRWSEAVATDSSGSVTVGANNDKSGYSLATAPPTAAANASATAAAILATPGNLLATDPAGKVVANNIPTTMTVGGYASGQDPATLILDAEAAAYDTSGTIGKSINSAGTAGDPWSTSLPGSYSAGTAGFIVATNLDANVGSRSTYAGGAVASVAAPVTVASNLDKTGYALTVPPPTAAQNATAVWTDTNAGDFGTPWSPGYGLLPDGVMQSATSTGAVLMAGDPMTAAAGVRRRIEVVGGTGVGQARIVTAYTGPTGSPPYAATVDRPWDLVPDSTSSYQWGELRDVYDLRRVGEDGLTPLQLQTLIFNAVAAALSGVPEDGTPGTITIRNGSNSADRLAIGVDGAGNRLSLTITPPPA